MRIFFYPPFKPLGHPHPSGDLVIATSLYDFLTRQGHQVTRVSDFRCRWIYWKPWLWPALAAEYRRVVRRTASDRPDLWFTYHTYYKAPDLLGPWVCRRFGLPYVIFQGSFATKRRRAMKSRPGFYLNRNALLAARHIFLNRQADHLNLKRLLPVERLTYVAPGIRPEEFFFDPAARQELRREWRAEGKTVVQTAAMFRPGVKTKGVSWVIRACRQLVRDGLDLILAIAGDGTNREVIQSLAEKELPGRVRLTGRIPRLQLYRFYSAGDVFAFPGFQESLGMVYLEAQSCGLPVVALIEGGVPEVVDNGVTGFLTTGETRDAFINALGRLSADQGLRRQMGQAARRHVRQKHDLELNYRIVEKKLIETAAAGHRLTAKG